MIERQHLNDGVRLVRRPALVQEACLERGKGAKKTRGAMFCCASVRLSQSVWWKHTRGGWSAPGRHLGAGTGGNVTVSGNLNGRQWRCERLLSGTRANTAGRTWRRERIGRRTALLVRVWLSVRLPSGSDYDSLCRSCESSCGVTLPGVKRNALVRDFACSRSLSVSLLGVQTFAERRLMCRT